VLAKPGEAAVLLDIDSFYSDFSVVVDGSAVFTRSILIGANHLVGEPEKWHKKFLQEVQQTLDSCKGELNRIVPDKIHLTGAGANLPGLPELLTEQTRLPAKAYPAMLSIEKIGRLPPLDSADYQTASLTPLLGAALLPGELELNLVPDSIALRRGLIDQAKAMTALGIMIMAALLAGSSYVSSLISARQAELKSLQREYAQAKPKVDQITQMSEIVKTVEQSYDPEFSPLNLLRELRTLLPEKAGFESIDIDLGQRTVTIKGFVDSWRSLSELTRSLDQSIYFSEAQTDSTTDRLDPVTKQVRFQRLTLKMENRP